MPPSGRIVYILQHFTKISETFILREIVSLRRRGVPVQVVALHRSRYPGLSAEEEECLRDACFVPFGLSPRVLWANAKQLVRSPGRYLRACGRMVGMDHRNLLYRLRALYHCLAVGYLAEILRGTSPCHLHAHFASIQTSMAVGLSALLDLPFSFTGHAKDIFVDANALQDKIRLASFVVTCSEYNADYLRRHCPELDPDRVVVIHCGIPVSRIRWSPPGPSDTPLILSVGRLVEKKGHRYLVQACEYMKRRGLRFRCLIIGDGPLRESLSEEIGRRDLEDCVALKGSLPYPEVRSYFRKSSAFVLPSVITPDGDREGLPVALMEALAFGVPAISTPTAGIPELVVNERTGLLVPPGNAQLLARAMERLIRDPELGRRLSVEGRETVRTGFEIEDTALQLAGLFRQSVGAISGVPANRETFLRAVI